VSRSDTSDDLEPVLLGAFLLFWLSSGSIFLPPTTECGLTSPRSDFSEFVRDPIDSRAPDFLGKDLLFWSSKSVHSLFILATVERTLSIGVESMLSCSRE